MRRQPEQRRVLATVLFTDIVGSTRRAAEIGDSAWADLLTAHHVIVRGQIARFGGTEVGTAGDGFLATFDVPARAVRCALEIVAEVWTIAAGTLSKECPTTGRSTRSRRREAPIRTNFPPEANAESGAALVGLSRALR
ncbi:MAG: adenylate/guanylate cyclase domain-containing protein [Chloroflexota bacterium]